jgi:hypothetical protein
LSVKEDLFGWDFEIVVEVNLRKRHKDCSSTTWVPRTVHREFNWIPLRYRNVVIFGQILDFMHEDNGFADVVIRFTLRLEREDTHIICVEDVKNYGRSIIIVLIAELNIKVLCLVIKRIVGLLNNIGLDEILS